MKKIVVDGYELDTVDATEKYLLHYIGLANAPNGEQLDFILIVSPTDAENAKSCVLSAIDKLWERTFESMSDSIKNAFDRESINYEIIFHDGSNESFKYEEAWMKHRLYLQKNAEQVETVLF